MRNYKNLTAFLLAGIAAGIEADDMDVTEATKLLRSYSEKMEAMNASETDISLAAQAAWEQTRRPLRASWNGSSTFDGAPSEGPAADAEADRRPGVTLNQSISTGLMGGPEDDAEEFSDVDPDTNDDPIFADNVGEDDQEAEGFNPDADDCDNE